MKKHLFFLYSICIIMICGLFPYNIPFDLTHSYSENEPIQVMAASAGHTDIKHAKTLRSGTSFQTKAAPEGFHYYCLFAPASRGEMTIKIRSSQRISLSFQLYDQKGLLYPPSDYTYDPEEHLLTIHYDTTAYRRYLLGLFNDQKHSLRYTITYSYTKTAPSPSPIIKHKRSPQNQIHCNEFFWKMLEVIGHKNCSKKETDFTRICLSEKNIFGNIDVI